MVVFKTKKIISSKSIGEDLEKGRKARNMSLRAVEQKCGVGEAYLLAMENNEWDLLPGEIYAKNWLKKYAIFLGLNLSEEIKKFEKPEYWIEYFAPEFKKDFDRIGISIDWRRNYITTSLNPHYDKFIRWQFRKLKEKDYVVKGKFPVVWCIKAKT